MLVRQARTTRDRFETACLAAAITVIALATPRPASAEEAAWIGSDAGSCLAGASPAPNLDPSQRHSASNRVLSLVARDVGAFIVDIHFDGPLVAFFGPGGGSHLDQFAAMIQDNDLGYTIGAPTGGYRNTWEWTEVVTMPDTDRPLVEFMWSIGQTIRPNGEVLEGNPADVDERVPVTAENRASYHALLLERAYAHLDALPGR